MERLEDARAYSARRRPLRLPEYRMWHMGLLVLVSGAVGWYGFYFAASWLFKLLSP